jgi:RHS repeat-associated protein
VLAYTLDPVGNCTALSVNGLTTTFGYDGVNELVSAQLGVLKTVWTYDQVGNHVEELLPLGGGIAYAYDDADRLLTAGVITFTYYANGNRLTSTSPAGTATYSYDAANHLTSVVGAGSNGSFGYDGDGNRVSQTTHNGTYTYVNDVARILPTVVNEQGPDGNIDYGYGRGLIESYSASFNYFYQYDGVGSVVALTDTKGKLQASYAYDAWGNQVLALPDVRTKNKFRFTGQALDPGTGLYYLRARYYDPSVGRFISRDPVGGLSRVPLSNNRYAYTLNNPLHFVDPSGYAPEVPGDLSAEAYYVPGRCSR